MCRLRAARPAQERQQLRSRPFRQALSACCICCFLRLHQHTAGTGQSHDCCSQTQAVAEALRSQLRSATPNTAIKRLATRCVTVLLDTDLSMQ